MASTNIQTFSGDVEIASNLTVDASTFHVDSVAGRVGIGKTDPAFTVDVTGTVNATSIYVGGSELGGDGLWTSDASDIYYTTGAVGIGTNLPAKTLEVQGTLRLSNAYTDGVSDLLLTHSNIWDQESKLTASDAAVADLFGESVAFSSDGTRVIVGAQLEAPGNVTNAGSAYIFTWNGSAWDSGTKIVASDAGQYDRFGWSVAISSDGNTALVGAVYDDNSYNDQGSAYIFTWNGSVWDSGTKIVASDPAAADYFGHSVAISGDGTRAIVGAYNNDINYTDQGSVYIFTRSSGNWDSGTRIVASDAAAADNFGRSVGISGDGNTALVGAYSKTVTQAYQGAAYIFTWNGSAWDSGTKIVASDPGQYDRFGNAVAISGDGSYAIVGAYNEDPGGVNQAGSAYIFTWNGSVWDSGTKILASDKAFADEFGHSVAISGDGTTAIVGVPLKDIGGVTNSGSAYIFKRTGSTWDAGIRFAPQDPVAYDEFGHSVAISGDGTRVIVGARYEDPGGLTSAGSAYILKDSKKYVFASTTPITANGYILSFTGQHTCFPDGPMSQGQIVSANKNKYITLNGPLTTGARAIKSSESIPVVCLSNVANDISVFGVVDRHEQGGTKRIQKSGIGNVTQEKELGDNRVIVNSIGEGAMWVANTNGNLVSGDYITSSNVAGYGQKQDDDTVYSYTVAKITMDCDFEPEDLPVQVIKKDAEGKNVLDTYGRIQWEDTDRTEKAYRIRYLTTEGQRTDQANAVWTAAYVGCTYHCG